MKTSCLMLSAILCLGAQASWAQDVCQQALANINQLEQQARQPGMPASDVARYNEAAQNYRNFYNQNCLGGGPASSGGGYSGGSGGNNKLDAMQQIFDGLAGMAAIMEQKRQREEAEARQQRLKWELERMEQEREDAEREAEARRKAAAAAKAEDDRKRQSIDNPFEPRNAASASDNPFETQRATSESDNPFDAPVANNSSSRKTASANPGTLFEAKACIRKQTSNIDGFLESARQCLLNTQLIASYGSEPFIDRGSDTEMWGRLANAKPRWVINGNRATPVCTLPLKVDSQYESFAECARVNLCAVRAANCTINAAQQAVQRKVGGNCKQLATACLASNPVPQTLAATNPVPQRATSSSSPVPRTSAIRIRPSGISGPSGRGSGALEPAESAK